MGKEIDLLKNYPKSKRNVSTRGITKSNSDKELARRFGKDFFDGERKVGYGGFSYDQRFWVDVVPDFVEYWGMKPTDSLLDVGCAKGFMLYDFARLIPGLTFQGVDISEYALENSLSGVQKSLTLASCDNLPFDDNSFDYTISITTIHNLDYQGCLKSLQEIERVSRKGSFITVDAYRTDDERKRMEDWNLTALTVLHVDDWRELFLKAGYTGDYFWFMP